VDALGEFEAGEAEVIERLLADEPEVERDAAGLELLGGFVQRFGREAVGEKQYAGRTVLLGEGGDVGQGEAAAGELARAGEAGAVAAESDDFRAVVEVVRLVVAARFRLIEQPLPFGQALVDKVLGGVRTI
jgi:hypothetical protein